MVEYANVFEVVAFLYGWLLSVDMASVFAIELSCEVVVLKMSKSVEEKYGLDVFGVSLLFVDVIVADLDEDDFKDSVEGGVECNAGDDIGFVVVTPSTLTGPGDVNSVEVAAVEIAVGIAAVAV